MSGRNRKIIRRFIIILVVLYVVGGIILFFIQDLLLFHPAPLPADHKFSFKQPYNEVNVPFEDGTLNLVQFNPSEKRKGIVLFFHGNMHNVEHYAKYPGVFLRNGFAIWMIDYPGFGKSTGKRSEQILYRQAEVIYQMAAKDIAADSILIYGKSVGTGIAAYLASRNKCSQLILETPYYNIDALAKHYFPMYPVIPMTKYSFPINKYLSYIKIPVTIFHGTSDEVVPYQHSVRLKNENPFIELITVDKGKHNDLFEYGIYQRKMDSLLNGN